jgi:hypothetical protein
VDVKKKRKGKKERRKENIMKVNMCVYFVYECFFYDKIVRIKKNLIF